MRHRGMVRKLKSGGYRLHSRKAAERHEREVQFFKRHR
jgi:hypothetical protein